MNKKLTIEYVRSEFEKEGCTLLSEEYVNSRTKLDYRCSKGHEYNTTWSHWRKCQKCQICYNKVKLTLEHVKESFEKNGYILLSKNYINANTKLDYICPKGHEHSIRWGDWHQGIRCIYCSGKIKFTLEQVRESFNKEDYILLSKNYINANTKLDYKCSKGHEHSIKWNDWQQGQRCAYCAGNIKLTIEQVRASFEKDNYILLSNEYVNTETKLNFRCAKGHEHSMEWHGWQRGNRCSTCANINSSLNQMGDKNHQWQGGISFEPYCEIWRDKAYKQDIRNRDGNRCLNPACNKNGSKLHIHHIDYNKKNCNPNNLITVCNSCNSSANKDRDWHTTWYQAIIKNRYYGGTKWH